ncbi:MAG: DNA-3-methyladenine glycosylase I [Bacteroidales bacterium]|nr:DNA-3-methyladenine glycosylase I [Bacteroidales bacterium]
MKCEWCTNNALLEKYHDEEWGTPVHDDQLLFEHLTLDGFQAGLSWQTILNRRENFRQAFDLFNIEKVAAYDQKKIEDLLLDTGIIRNRQKVEATVHNARLILTIQKEFGSFDSYIWGFTKGKAMQNRIKSMSAIPATSELSDQISQDLRKRGFKFAGSTICYAFLQAVGVVNDHVASCFRYQELGGK